MNKNDLLNSALQAQEGASEAIEALQGLLTAGSAGEFILRDSIGVIQAQQELIAELVLYITKE